MNLFNVRISHTAHLNDISNLFIDFKPRESLGHSNTDVSLISKMCFAVLELIQITLPCIYTNSFRILFWHNKPYRRGLKYQEEEI